MTHLEIERLVRRTRRHLRPDSTDASYLKGDRMRRTVKTIAVVLGLGVALVAAAPVSALKTQTTILDVDSTFVFGAGDLSSSSLG